MATVCELPVAQQVQSEQRFLLYNVSWQTYEALYQALCHRPALRMNYDGETLEFMTISFAHEYAKEMIGSLINLVAFVLNIPILRGGSMTCKSPVIRRGFEPDCCYWIANEIRVRGKKDLDFTTDPPPDLAIEIKISQSLLDRIEFYARLGVSEIWRIDGETIRVYLLQPNGEYQLSRQSLAFPYLPVEELVPYLHPDEQTDDTTRLRTFADWLHAQNFEVTT